MKYYNDDYDPPQQQQIESVREICLEQDEANELLRLIHQTREYLIKQMAHGYYQDVEFLDGLKSWVEYDRHVTHKQMRLFWSIHDRIPEKLSSGLV